MYSHKDFPYNIATLSFTDQQLEAGFRNDYFNKNLRFFRFFLVIGTVFYALYGIHDYWILPDIVHEAWAIRYLFVCPLLSIICACSYMKQFRQSMEPLLGLAGFAAGAGLIAMIIKAQPPGSYMCYTGLLLCLVFYFRLRFVTATILSWSIFVLYEISAILDPGTPPRVLFSNSFIMLSFIIVGMFTCYAMERYMRSDYLLRTIINERNDVIHAINHELEREIRERKQTEEDKLRLEKQLFQTQKLEAVGQLAGGISHEFNNILTAIIGYANYLQLKMEQTDPLIPYPGNIIALGQRAARLTNDLLAFSRKQQIEPKPVDLNALPLKAKTFLTLMLPKNICLTLTTWPEPIMVYADDVLMEQVLVNLAANSRDAMTDGGTLSVCCDVAHMEEPFSHAHGTGPVGSYGRITVTDSGGGMDEATRARIFEPFFTTKEVGKGSGLGLSMAYGIIQQHHGYMDVTSATGNGTTFTIFLPLYDADRPTDRHNDGQGALTPAD
jgi:signal transduction histidine kinase